MQLASKMRYLSAQFEALLSNDLWKNNAAHANKMAQLLAQRLQEIHGIQITQKVEANGVFAIIPQAVIPILQKDYFFFVWDENTSEVRWLCSFDTSEEDVLDFTGLIARTIRQERQN